MQEKSFRLPEPESMAVRAADVDKLINAAEPVMALVYLYILRYREVAPAQISRALNMDVKEAETVCARLEQMGLLRTERTSGRYVTEDEALIAAVRRDLAREKIDEFVKNMSVLGYGRRDIVTLVKEFVEGEKNNG